MQDFVVAPAVEERDVEGGELAATADRGGQLGEQMRVVEGNRMVHILYERDAELEMLDVAEEAAVGNFAQEVSPWAPLFFVEIEPHVEDGVPVEDADALVEHELACQKEQVWRRCRVLVWPHCTRRLVHCLEDPDAGFALAFCCKCELVDE